MTHLTFFDIETDTAGKKILAIGAIKSDGTTFNQNSISAFTNFIQDSEFIVGHNIFVHDLKFLYANSILIKQKKAIDTLVFSPLLFPEKPYHKLLKDDKLQVDELNNPLNDSIKSRDLFFDELNAFNALEKNLKVIFYGLLNDQDRFTHFFNYQNFSANITSNELTELIQKQFKTRICDNANIHLLIEKNPVALAYALSLINCKNRYSISPPWVLKNFPNVEQMLFLLKTNRCLTGCNYCKESLNPTLALREYFGFEAFRSYNGMKLQEKAAQAAVDGESILTIFPTGGGKSITFQVPALMSGRNAHALTVIISPLQSLMKDQVDNLEKHQITEAVTINGMQDPIDRAKSIERVANGSAFLLYISPESLRSVTIERLLLKRNIARFVIDEAHCFSSWGQDFRVDYIYIADFIKNLQKKKNLDYKIPVSCFTATAKLKVIEDICAYFKTKLDIDLVIFSAKTTRTNLHFQVYLKDSEEEKYAQLRSLIEEKKAPAIVYVSRTKRAYKLAERLCADGFLAKPYHGKMEKTEKSANQDAFKNDAVDVMVATSAFGMGVDKNNVEKVIHYDISDSLENYVQESGRAGRDEKINAECYILFNEEDLDKHFILLNQTKISGKEINQIWKAVKDLTKTRAKVSNSALEIARKAGWDDGINEIETRVITAIAALEDAKYLKRGQNFPRVFANSILSKNATEAIEKINSSTRFTDKQKINATRIIKKLFSSKSKRLSTEEQAESRVDYISDQLGIVKDDVIRTIELMRDEGILANTQDLTAFVRKGEQTSKIIKTVSNYIDIETALLDQIDETEQNYHLKELNEYVLSTNIESSINHLKTILNFWVVKNLIKKQNKEYSRNHLSLVSLISKKEFQDKIDKRHKLIRFIAEYLTKRANSLRKPDSPDDILVEFSVLEIKNEFEKQHKLFQEKASIDDVEDALFYLTKIDALKIEGGFLVVYNRLTLERKESNNRKQYTETDYEKLKLHYQQKVQQIHIVGEYAKKMISNYDGALRFVDDYFNLNYASFLQKYFPGSRADEIRRTLTPEKYMKLTLGLDDNQRQIIEDSGNKYLVVAAGPGSGKTRVLVHKLASLILTEDVKTEQLLMLAFSRAAVTDFKRKLLNLIGNVANYIEIKTFHAYGFDLLGRVGNIEQSNEVIQKTVQKIRAGEIEPNYITKTVLVVDEAQDMNENEFELVRALMEQNEEMRVILVGDDDQNIYEFRGSDSKYMQELLLQDGAYKHELRVNYRSKSNIVSFANHWLTKLSNRLKTKEGVSKQSENGQIKIIQYKSSRLIVPLVDQLVKTELAGSTCVLTTTNEEASQILGLLLKREIPSKLIQSNDGFSLKDLYEIRCFSNLILMDETIPNISDSSWESAKQKINSDLQKSTRLQVVNQIIDAFEKTNTKRKYKSDWQDFVRDSGMEDFISIGSDTIYVSTIHKSKGKEFDNVVMLLNGFQPDTNERKRQFYVGVTRAKNNLTIHYNVDYLNNTPSENLEYLIDSDEYPEPEQIVIHLNHKNVYLSFFEAKQNEIKELNSGESLKISEAGIQNKAGKLILKFSKEFNEIVSQKMTKGYQLHSAKVNFKVYWWNEQREKEYLIFLPEVVMVKNNGQNKLK